jgi:hypothetical protein
LAEKNLSVNIRVNTETGQLEVLGAKLKEAGEAGKQAGGMFSNLGGEAGKLFSAFLPFATAGGVVAFFAGAVKGASEEQESLKRVGFALEASGVSWKANEDKVLAWGQAIQQTTRFADNEAYESLGKLTRVTGDLGQAQKASQVAMGLSVTSGQSLAQTTELVSNLLAGNERAVKQARDEYGAFVGNARTAQEVLTALGSTMATVAQNEEGFAKESAKLKNAFGELQDQVGAGIIPGLTIMVQWLQTGFEWFEKLGVVVATVGASVANEAQHTIDSIKGLWNDGLAGVEQSNIDFEMRKKIIQEVSLESMTEIEGRKVKALANTAEAGIQLDAKKNAQTLAADAKAAETAIKEKRKAQEAQDKIVLDLSNDLEKKMAGLGKDTLKRKQDLLNAELKQERDKITHTVEDKFKEKELVDKLETWGTNRHRELVEIELHDKQESAYKVVDLALQTFQVLNEMGDKSSKANANRAKMILAMEQAIAIARVWSSAAQYGPLGPAIAAAQTALYIAQFAAQSQNIDRAQQAAERGKIETRIINTLNPNGSVLQDSFGGGPIASSSPGVAGALGFEGESAMGGGVYQASAVGTVYGGGGGGGTGGGTQINVSIPQININVAIDTLEVADRRRLLQALGDELRSETVEAIRFAVTSANVANRNSQVAV